MTHRILCVDDEPNILAGFKRALHRRYTLDVATGPKEGLEALRKDRYAVVVADLRMPGMDGIAFLATVRTHWPETVRVMLTGENDFGETIRAVNTGNLFRFLSKPCSPEDLAKTLDAALAQYDLITAEKELLEKTLAGSVRMLTEVLALASPQAFGRALRARRFVREMVEQLRTPNRWQIEMATMLSQLGCITLPGDLLDKIVSGAGLAEHEADLAQGRFKTGSNLIRNIPRMEPVARMISLQPAIAEGRIPDDPASEGACMLYLALEVEARSSQGGSLLAILGELRGRLDARFKPYLDILEGMDAEAAAQKIRSIQVVDLTLGMVLAEDVRTRTGLLLVGKGQEVTDLVLTRLRGYARTPGIKEPFKVTVP